MKKLERLNGELFETLKKNEISTIAEIEGGLKHVFFDSSKGLYVNGMLVDEWAFKLTLLGYDVARPIEIENNLDIIVEKISNMDSTSL